MSGFYVSLEADLDLAAIWRYIASGSVDAADRVQSEFNDVFAALGRMPGLGHLRTDLTQRAVLFFPLYSYLIIYQVEAETVRILAIIHGNRNLKRLLEERAL